MTIIECIDEYGMQVGDVIFTDDIYHHVTARIPGVQRDAVNTNIARYVKAHPCLARHRRTCKEYMIWIYIQIVTHLSSSSTKYPGQAACAFP